MKQMNSSHPPKEKNKRCVDTLVRLKILFTQRDMNTKNKVHVPKSTRYNYSFEYLMLVSSQAFFVVARHVTTTAVAIWLSLRMTFWEIQNFCARAKVGPRTSEEGIFIGCMSKELLDDADQLGTVWEVLQPCCWLPPYPLHYPLLLTQRAPVVLHNPQGHTAVVKWMVTFTPYHWNHK